MRRAPKYVLLGAIPAAISGAVARGTLGAVVGGCVGAIGGAVGAILSVPHCPLPTTPVLLIGDSLAVGLGPRLARLADSCGTRFGYSATVGSHVQDWTHARFAEALTTMGGPEGITGGVVLVSLGGNDFQHGDPSAVDAAIGDLLARIASAGAAVRWIAPPTLPFDDTAGARALWRHWLGRDPWTGYYPTDEVRYPVAPDGIHPTARGYAELAAAIWRWLAIVET